VGTGLFGQTPGSPGSAAPAAEQVKSPAERGEELAKLIRTTIEPDIWSESGAATECSVKYHEGMLIVRAPQYVQNQIGTPVTVRESAAPASAAPTKAP
jgi:hypothetical protein